MPAVRKPLILVSSSSSCLSFAGHHPTPSANYYSHAQDHKLPWPSAGSPPNSPMKRGSSKSGPPAHSASFSEVALAESSDSSLFHEDFHLVPFQLGSNQSCRTVKGKGNRSSGMLISGILIKSIARFVALRDYWSFAHTCTEFRDILLQPDFIRDALVREGYPPGFASRNPKRSREWLLDLVKEGSALDRRKAVCDDFVKRLEEHTSVKRPVLPFLWERDDHHSQVKSNLYVSVKKDASEVAVLDMGSTGNFIRLDLAGRSVARVLVAPSGTWLAITTIEHKLLLYKTTYGFDIGIEAGTNLQAIRSLDVKSMLTSISFSEDSTKLILSCEEQTIRVWDLASGYPYLLAQMHSETTPLVFSPGYTRALVTPTSQRRSASLVTSREFFVKDFLADISMPVGEIFFDAESDIFSGFSNDARKLILHEPEGKAYIYTISDFFTLAPKRYRTSSSGFDQVIKFFEDKFLVGRKGSSGSSMYLQVFDLDGRPISNSGILPICNQSNWTKITEEGKEEQEKFRDLVVSQDWKLIYPYEKSNEVLYLDLWTPCPIACRLMPIPSLLLSTAKDGTTYIYAETSNVEGVSEVDESQPELPFTNKHKDENGTKANLVSYASSSVAVDSTGSVFSLASCLSVDPLSVIPDCRSSSSLSRGSLHHDKSKERGGTETRQMIRIFKTSPYALGKEAELVTSFVGDEEELSVEKSECDPHDHIQGRFFFKEFCKNNTS
ncbi:hypothetical protein IE53DRAFT_145525 [Violaceomyces palustris]|uniref:Uncharacterized protein n=1 Tax=Violaceomyces palustris TaxID=1673888 RepID=A0ACD0P6A2_9BASI|nr:hypothetical protein IE53DRAFT_145525 [Violaceomyces palustris]